METYTITKAIKKMKFFSDISVTIAVNIALTQVIIYGSIYFMF